MNPQNPLFSRILPYLMIAFMIVLFVISIFIFSYIFIIAIILGLILFAIGYIRAKFFGHKINAHFSEEVFVVTKNKKPTTSKVSENTGRIIEHDEKNKDEMR